MRANSPPTAHRGARAATRAGVALLGQIVLLRGVNDSAEALEELFRAMLRARVKPYYLHQLDPAPGTARFAVPVEEGRACCAALRGRVTGLAWPTYVQEPGRRRQGAARPGIQSERGVAKDSVSTKRSGGMSLRRCRAISCRASMSRSPAQASPTAPRTRAAEA